MPSGNFLMPSLFPIAGSRLWSTWYHFISGCDSRHFVAASSRMGLNDWSNQAYYERPGNGLSRHFVWWWWGGGRRLHLAYAGGRDNRDGNLEI